MRDAPRSFTDRWLPRSAFGEPEEERAGRVVTASALAAALFSGILAASRFGLEGLGSPVGRALAGSVLGFALAPVAMRLTNSRRVGALLVPAVGIASLLGMAMLEEGLRSEAFYWFPFVPLVAALVLGGVGAAVFGALCAAGTAGLAALHHTGFPFEGPPLVGRALLLHFAAAANAPLFGAFLGWLYERNRLRRSRELEVARQRNAALLSALPDAVVRIAADGTIADLELPADAPARFQVGEILGRRLEELFPASVAEKVHAQIRTTLDAGRLTRREYEIQFGGEPVDLELRAAPHGRFDVIGIVRDVTQRKRLDAMRDDFVATVSHELRTPLTSIHGSLRLIAGGVLGEIPGEVKDLAEVASANSDRLQRLIDDLLDMRRIESGRLDLRIEPVDLAKALQQSLRVNQGYAEAHGVRLVLEEPLPGSEVEVDPDRFQQIMANLLSNAVKHSPQGEQVRITLGRDAERARVSVRDAGPGIEPAFRPRVFDRFAQADSSASRSVGGTGLGLAICKRLVEELGGRIGFETGLGEGTCFFFELPLRDPADV